MESRELDSICHITRRRHLKNKCLPWIWCQSGTAWAGTLMVQLFEGPAKVDWYIYASQQVLINMLLFQLFCFFRVCNWNQFQKDVTFSENKCYVFSNTQRLFKWSANHCAVFFLIFYTAAQFWGGGKTGFYFTCHISFHRQLLKINMLPPNRFVIRFACRPALFSLPLPLLSALGGRSNRSRSRHLSEECASTPIHQQLN